ncbi:MAG: ribonuclease III, partial [Mycoplasmoidaceae bacterium]|nr:ribonuclease III [Mycoplasmoidaceae bacterium]
LNYDYQRLEFLGDAIIEKNVREFLFKKYPEKDEGEMTKIKIMIVQSHTEVLAAKSLELNKYIFLQNSLVDDQGNIPDKILEDSFEALIAAIYFDLGEKTVYQVLKRTIIHFYEIHYLDKTSTDYKSLFQEAIQKYGKKRIKYIYKQYVDENGDTRFRVELRSDNICYGVGHGSKKKDAEREAAMNAYNKLVKK